LTILTIGIVVAHLVGSERRRVPTSFAALLEELRSSNQTQEEVELGPELLKPVPDLGRVIAALQSRDGSDAAAAAKVDAALRASRLGPREKNVALAYWATHCSELSEPGADLLFFAHLPDPHPYANELVGDCWSEDSKKQARARQYYERELAIRPEAKAVRQKLVELEVATENYARLAVLAKDPGYAEFFDDRLRLEIAMHARDWAGIWTPLIALQKENYAHRIPVILTGVAGGVWLVLAWQMLQVPGLLSFRVWGSFLALALGAVSTLPVLFLDVYQSEAWGLKHTGRFFDDCVFFVAGVGLREELCKLLFFLPLVPILLWRGRRLEMVVLAGCVGLGFAVEENLSYFRSADPSLAFGRFLTANFFHFAATGVVGVAFCDAIRNPRRGLLKFLLTFVAVAAAHGFYDVFLSAPKYVFKALALSCFILVSLAFFREVARERGSATDQVFPAATMIVGLCILLSTVLITAAIEYGVKFAGEAVLTQAIVLSLFVYMFFVLFRDGLQEEEEVAAPNYEGF
jgi:protease PrsW